MNSIMSADGCASTRLPRGDRSRSGAVLQTTQERNRFWLQIMRNLNLTVVQMARRLGEPYSTVARGIQHAQEEERIALARDAAAEAETMAEAAAIRLHPEADLTPEEVAALAESGLDLDDLYDLKLKYGPESKFATNPVVSDFLARIRADDLIAAKRLKPAREEHLLLTNTVSTTQGGRGGFA